MGFARLCLVLIVLACLASSSSGAAATTSRSVGVTETEYRITLGRTTVPHGRITFYIANFGQDDHNLKVARHQIGHGFSGRIPAGGHTQFTVTLKAVDLAGNHPATRRAGTRSRSGRAGRAEVAVGDHAGRAPRVGNRRPAVTELANGSASHLQKRYPSERSPIPRFMRRPSVLRRTAAAMNAVYGSRKHPRHGCATRIPRRAEPCVRCHRARTRRADPSGIRQWASKP